MSEKAASTHHDSLQQEGSLPFFARFLEGQNNATQTYHTDDNKGGDDSLLMSLKYPSDRDEGDFT